MRFQFSFAVGDGFMSRFAFFHPGINLRLQEIVLLLHVVVVRLLHLFSHTYTHSLKNRFFFKPFNGKQGTQRRRGGGGGGGSRKKIIKKKPL